MSLIGTAIIIFLILTLAVGLWSRTKVQGRAENYYTAGRSMPVWVTGLCLCAPAFDANGSIGNVNLSFTSGFWAGALIPLGLAGCLALTGLFFSGPVHRMGLLTLADFYARRYGRFTETLAVLSLIAANVILIAGNLAGLGLLLGMVFGADYLAMLAAMAALILLYSVTGGVYSTITTSVFQVSIFIVGLLVFFFFLIAEHGWSNLLAPVPARAMDLSGLLERGNGALLNWASLVSLAVGDVVAIDFMQRVISARSPQAARRGCFLAAGVTLAVGLPVSLVGLFAHYLGADPGSHVLVDLALNRVPVLISGLVLVGIIAASMSTAAGVVIALSNMITRNMVQRYSKDRWDDQKLLSFSRWIGLPTMASAVLFAYLRPEPGVLLILAFDVVLAGCFVPFALGIYWKKSNTPGAVASILVGGVLRLILYYSVPEPLAGLDTLIPPLLGLVCFVVVSKLTHKRFRPRHEELLRRPSAEELVAGAA